MATNLKKIEQNRKIQRNQVFKKIQYFFDITN